MAKALKEVFAEARKAAFKDAKGLVKKREPTQAEKKAAAKAGKKPPAAKIVKTPYRQANTTLRKKYATRLSAHATNSAERKRLELRVQRMVWDALGSVGITPYRSPVTAGTLRMRTDSGVDFQGEPGHHVLAIGNAEVTSMRRVGGFGMLAVYRLLDGPREGQHVYVGHADPVVKKGDVIKVGAPVARLREHAWGLRRTSPHSRGWVEIGFAAGPLGLPESYKEHDPGVAHDLSTRAGVEFSTFLRRCFGI
jgi:hypothetical protein